MSGLLLLRRPSSRVRCLSSSLSQVRHYALIGKRQTNNEPRWALPKTPARTRFAPSPTGYLHLGSLRTALYNYLLAQATGGQFILRLEDTDQARLVSDAEKVLYDDLTWAGLHWDEGPDKNGPFGPYRQSERLEIYKQHANALLESGHAFRCFCNRQALELNVAQVTAHGGAAHYPGTCLHVEQGESDRRAANGEPHVIRFKAAEQPGAAHDLVYGTYKKAEREDSFIIMKSDGFPTYHFANVVDDHFMEITHVIRGAEWLISTPKHVELYNAFGWQSPHFAHVGLLVDAQRQKLSKRDMANIGVSVYRSNKILPEALLNFSALLGWDPNLQKNTHLNKRGTMTMAEMKDNFTLKFTRGDIVVDLTKLKFFQQRLTRNLISGDIVNHAVLSKEIVQPILAEVGKLEEQLRRHLEIDDKTRGVGMHGVDYDDAALQKLLDSLAPRAEKPDLTEDYVLKVLKAWKGPVDDPAHFLHHNHFAFFRPSKTAMRKQYHELQKSMKRVMILKDNTKLLNTDVSKVLRMFTFKLKNVKSEDWNSEKLGDIVKQLTDTVKFYDTNANVDRYESAGWTFMRLALLNGKSGLAIVPTMQLLGQEETIHRVRIARKIATAEEDKAGRATELAQAQDEGAKVRIRHLESDSLGKDAKQTATGSKNQVIEPRNIRVIEHQESKKAPTPPGIGPFSIYTNRETGRGDNSFKKEGPFTQQAPSPPPPRSRPREASEAERAPQFMSSTEFRTGTRRIKEPSVEDSVATFTALDKLESQRIAQRQQEEARIIAKSRSQEDGWFAPKVTFSQEKGRPGLPEGPGPFRAGNSLPVSYDEHIKSIGEHNKRAAAVAAIAMQKAMVEAARLRRLKTSPSVSQGPMYAGTPFGGLPRDVIAKASNSNRFRDEVIDVLPATAQSKDDVKCLPQDLAAQLAERHARHLEQREFQARNESLVAQYNEKGPYIPVAPARPHRTEPVPSNPADTPPAQEYETIKPKSSARPLVAYHNKHPDRLKKLDRAVVKGSTAVANAAFAQLQEPVRSEPAKRNSSSPPPGTGAFLPTNVATPIVKRDEHLKHLKALNRTMALRKAKKQREENNTRFSRLTSFGKLGPSTTESTFEDKAQSSAARGRGEATAHEGEEASRYIEGLAMRELTAETKRELLVPAVWSRSSALDFRGMREAAATTKVEDKSRQQTKAYLKAVEQNIARNWAHRNN